VPNGDGVFLLTFDKRLENTNGLAGLVIDLDFGLLRTFKLNTFFFF